MQARSTMTGTTYSSWDELVENEANGFVVVSILQHTSPTTGKTQVFARTTGPFSDKRAARNKAASLRRQWKHALPDERQGSNLLTVSIEPLWVDLQITDRG